MQAELNLNSNPVDESLWVDIRDQMPVNLAPDEPWLVSEGRTGWWKRTPEQITGITLHHTLTHNLMATAEYITRPQAQGGKGLPTTQYAFWVQIDGVINYCVDLSEAPWHDHCGDENQHISIGLAGRWDAEVPPRGQLEATARLTVYLMEQYNIPLENVDGHREWSKRHTGQYKTSCPGWAKADWRDFFFHILRSQLHPEAVSFSVPMPDTSAMAALLAQHDEGR